MKNLSKQFLTLGLICLAMACSGSPDRIQGGANPEADLLPPDPSFSGNVTVEACISAVDASLSQARCWKRGDSTDDNYTEIWFAPDSSASKTGLLGYEMPGVDSTQIEYEISNCDANEIKMPQAGGIKVKVSGTQLDFQFDKWGQAYRYTATNDCTLSPK